MKRKQIRTAEVTIETEEKMVLRATKGGQSPLAFCSACGRQVGMVTPEQAAQIAPVNPRAVYAQMECRRIHSLETPEGLLFVCLESLTGLKAAPDG